MSVLEISAPQKALSRIQTENWQKARQIANLKKKREEATCGPVKDETPRGEGSELEQVSSSELNSKMTSGQRTVGEREQRAVAIAFMPAHNHSKDLDYHGPNPD